MKRDGLLALLVVLAALILVVVLIGRGLAQPIQRTCEENEKILGQLAGVIRQSREGAEVALAIERAKVADLERQLEAERKAKGK